MNDLLSSKNAASGTARARVGTVLPAMLVALFAALAMLASAGTASAAIPSSFFAVVDQQGVNDVNADQNDLTQMGRDDSDAAMYKLFWSWDSTSQWLGNGQTGDACALFDSDGDGNVNYAVCARIENPNADPTQAKLTSDSPFLFSCDDSKNDRCGQPTQLVATTITTGTIGSGGVDRTGNLITDTDPFAPAGSDSPNDVTLQINIPKILLNGGVLVNVCSYPSAGNGGNNNPFDCVVTPGVQFGTLRVTKVLPNDNGSTAVASSFSFTVDGGSAVAFEADGTNDIAVTVGNHSVVEVGVPIAGFDTTYTNSVNANTNCTSLAVSVGGTTTCTITNNDQAPSLTLIKNVKNDNGKTSVATSWTLSAGGAGGFTDATLSSITTETGYNSSASTGVKTVTAGVTYALSESATPGGYTAGSWVCTGGTQGTGTDSNKITLAVGESATCRIANDDNIATPGIGSTMRWTLNDRVALTGWVSGGSASTVTFTLFKDTASLSSCEPSTQVATYTPETVAVNDTAGTATTVTGFTTEASGNYRWIASFSGNDRNAAISTTCTAEVTNLP